MAHPIVGDKIQYIPYTGKDTITGIVDWVGSMQFAVTSMDDNKHREIVLFSDNHWKILKIK